MLNMKSLSDLLGEVDFDNEYDFESFEEYLFNNFDVEESDIVSILDFLINDLEIRCDAELYSISDKEKKQLLNVMNEIMY